MNPLIIIILGTLSISGWLWIRAKPIEQRKGAMIKLAVLLLVAVIIILSVTGRLPWMGTVFAGLLLVLKRYGFLLLKLFPFLRSFVQQRTANQQGQHHGQHQGQARNPNNSQGMSKDQAQQILGLSDGFSASDIQRAHRKLMQKVHPDRGGNDYLAAQLNAARELLMQDFD